MQTLNGNHCLLRLSNAKKIRERTRSVTAIAAIRSPRRERYSGNQTGGKYFIIEVEPDASDSWRLDPAIEMLKNGAVGIIPTDSYPAIVCDLGNKAAVQLLYEMKGTAPSKRLSILCRSFHDIAKYTLGFPALKPGQRDFFKIAKQILPGPYTLILHASKEMPKLVLNYQSGKSKRRVTVGVRLPDDPVCQAILERLERPLLCTTATMSADDGLAEAALLADEYSSQGLSFVVDVGARINEPSTVVDLTSSADGPVVVREGKGRVDLLEQ